MTRGEMGDPIEDEHLERCSPDEPCEICNGNEE